MGNDCTTCCGDEKKHEVPINVTPLTLPQLKPKRARRTS
jgi:hypothetical protein